VQPFIPGNNPQVRVWWIGQHRNELEKVIIRIAKVDGGRRHPREHDGFLCGLAVKIERLNTCTLQCLGCFLWAASWLVASVCCWAASGFVGAVAAPIYEDASRLPRFIARFVVASTVSFLLTVLIGLLSFSIITAFHRSVVH
jgi:hypothetical protein